MDVAPVWTTLKFEGWLGTPCWVFTCKMNALISSALLLLLIMSQFIWFCSTSIQVRVSRTFARRQTHYCFWHLPGFGVKQNQMSWPNVERGETNCIIYLLVQGEMVVRVLWQCKLLPVWYKWYVGPNQKPWLICCCLQIGTPTVRVAN